MEAKPSARQSRRWWLLGLLLVSAGFGLGFGLYWFDAPDVSQAGAAFVWGAQAGATPYFTTLAAPVHVSSAPAPVAGAPAPDFSLKSLDGQTISLSQLKGHPVLINFWASWCPPCRLEMPDLVRDYEAHKAEGFVLLASTSPRKTHCRTSRRL